MFKDDEGSTINPGNVIVHNYGIPPTTVRLFVFGDYNADHLHLIDAAGNISTLTSCMAENSTKEGE